MTGKYIDDLLNHLDLCGERIEELENEKDIFMAALAVSVIDWDKLSPLQTQKLKQIIEN